VSCGSISVSTSICNSQIYCSTHPSAGSAVLPLEPGAIRHEAGYEGPALHETGRSTRQAVRGRIDSEDGERRLEEWIAARREEGR